MHIYSRYKSYKNPPFLTKQRVFLVRPMRFERTAFGVGVQRSIQLSYGRGYGMYYSIFPAICKASVSSFCCFLLRQLHIPPNTVFPRHNAVNAGWFWAF